MDLGLKGKRVLVTGGTKSIGRAIVDAFVAEGAVVAFCARDAKLVKEREKDWQSKQARVAGTALDVIDNASLKKWIDDAAKDGDMKPTSSVNIAPPIAANTAAAQKAKILKLATL